MYEYYIGEVKVTVEKFRKIISKLEMSNMDWEVDYSSNRTTIYILQ